MWLQSVLTEMDAVGQNGLTNYVGLECIIARPQELGGSLGKCRSYEHLPRPLYLSGFVYFQAVLGTNKVGLKTDGS